MGSAGGSRQGGDKGCEEEESTCWRRGGEHEGKHSPGIAQAPPPAGELPLPPHLGKLIGVEHAGESDSVVQRDLQPPLALLQRRRCRLTSIAAVRPKLLPRLVSNVLGLLLYISAGGLGVRGGCRARRRRRRQLQATAGGGGGGEVHELLQLTG